MSLVSYNAYSINVQSQYDLINIVRITVQPSSDNDGSKVIELQFTRELPSNWKEEFNKIKL